MDIFLLNACFLDPCFQPIGISNGLAKDIGSNDIRFTIPLKDGCRQFKYVHGNLVTPMTIKGIAFRSKQNINGMPLNYAFIDANPWIPVRKSSRTQASKKRVSFHKKCNQIMLYTIDLITTMNHSVML